jgi:hypothetical protein
MRLFGQLEGRKGLNSQTGKIFDSDKPVSLSVDDHGPGGRKVYLDA